MIFNKVFFYAIGWGIYWMQGGFIPRGLFFAKVLCLILLTTSIYHVIMVNFSFRIPKYFYGLNILLGLFFIYNMLNLFGVNKAPMGGEYLKSIFCSLLPIYSFYYYSKTGAISEINFKELALVILFFSMLKYYGRFFYFSLITDSGGFTNNSGYLFISFISISAVLCKNKLLRYFLIGYCLFVSIQSAKRGAIVICFCCLLWFFANEIRKKNLREKIFFLFFILLFSGFSFFVYCNQMSGNVALQRKIMDLRDGGGSGRSLIYSSFSNYVWNETSLLQFIFGQGPNSSLSVFNVYAHNDWLELGINQGLIGVMVYIFYWMLFCKEIFSKKYESSIRLALQLVFIDYFLRTFFSMSYGAMATSSTFVLGYCLAQEKKNEQNF